MADNKQEKRIFEKQIGTNPSPSTENKKKRPTSDGSSSAKNKGSGKED